MRYVYAVTAGEYDDYHIVGIYSSKEKAEPVAMSLFSKGEQGYVEKYPINQQGSVYRDAENQIRSKRYIPKSYYEDQEYITDYITGDEHFDLYMERLHKTLEKQKKERGGKPVVDDPPGCFSTSMPQSFKAPQLEEEKT